MTSTHINIIPFNVGAHELFSAPCGVCVCSSVDRASTGAEQTANRQKKVLVDSWPSDKNKILDTVQSCTPNHAPNKIYAKIKFIVAFFLGILWRGEELLNIWLILQLH